MSLCVFLCVQISNKIGAVGLPILATFIGVAAAAFLTTLTGLTGDAVIQILLNYGGVIILLVVVWFMFRGGAGVTLKALLLLVIDGLFAVITTAYASGLAMAANGAYASDVAIEKICVLTVIEIVSAVIVWAVNALAGADRL